MNIVKRQELELTNQPTIIISDKVHSQINTLHNQVGKVEWSGVLFLNKLEGDISSPSSLVYRADYIMLQDIDSPGYTSYTISESDLFSLYDIHPHLEDCKIAQIHTHHSMSTFFSITDLNDLHTVSPDHNYYISLIVNFDSQWMCKLAFIANQERVLNFKGSEGEDETLNLNTTEVLVHMNCKIVMSEDEYLLQSIVKYKDINSKRVVKEEKKNKLPNKSLPVIPLKNYEIEEEYDYRYFADDVTVDNFLVKLLSLDINSKLTLEQVISNINKFTPPKYVEYIKKLTDKYILTCYNKVCPKGEYELYIVLNDASIVLDDIAITLPKNEGYLQDIIKVLDDCIDYDRIEQ